MKKLAISYLFVLFSLSIIAQPPNCPPVGTTEGEELLPPKGPSGGSGGNEVEGSRVVYYLHGLGGNTEQWSPVSTHYEDEYQIVSAPFHTFPTTGIVQAAASLRSNMTGDNENTEFGIDPETNIVIAQSLGGLVARALDRRYVEEFDNVGRKMGGLITFATAHQGAQILNNVDTEGPAMANELSELIITEMLAGPFIALKQEIVSDLKDIIPNWAKALSFGLGPGIGIATSIIDDKLGDVGEDVSIDNLQPFIDVGLDFSIPTIFAPFLSNVGKEHQVGHPVVESLNQFDSEMPMVSIYSIESDPVFWRVISSLTEQVPHEFPVFEATDELWIEKSEELLMEYIAERDAPLIEAQQLGLNIIGWTPEALELRDAWDRGVDFLLNVNSYWEIIIGRKTVSVAVNCHCLQVDNPFVDNVEGILTYLDGNPFVDNEENSIDCTSLVFPLSANSPGAIYQCSEIGVNISFNLIGEGSDGIVLAHSAEDLPGRITSIRIEDANHMEMRNHSETKRVLDALFDGDLVQDFSGIEFFIVPEDE